MAVNEGCWNAWPPVEDVSPADKISTPWRTAMTKTPCIRPEGHPMPISAWASVLGIRSPKTPKQDPARRKNIRIEAFGGIGWGTWIRTKINGVRVRRSTIELFPNEGRGAPSVSGLIAKTSAIAKTEFQKNDRREKSAAERGEARYRRQLFAGPAAARAVVIAEMKNRLARRAGAGMLRPTKRM